MFVYILRILQFLLSLDSNSIVNIHEIYNSVRLSAQATFSSQQA